MYRVGTKQFPTPEEAQTWIDQQPTGHYEIVPLAWCEDCRDWVDTTALDNKKLCAKCQEEIENQ